MDRCRRRPDWRSAQRPARGRIVFVRFRQGWSEGQAQDGHKPTHRSYTHAAPSTITVRTSPESDAVFTVPLKYVNWMDVPVTLKQTAGKSDTARTAMPDYGVAPPRWRLPSGARLGPVRLQVADLRRSEDFYSRVLGLETVAHEDGRAALRGTNGSEPLVELVERPGVRPAPRHGRIGLYHFALLLPERASLARFALHTQRLGLRVAMSDHLVSEALYLSDPDGLGIEVYADRPRSEWRSHDRQLRMATQPLDLADLLAQAGTDQYAGAPSGTVVGHVHLHVGDLSRAARFYHEALGFDKVVWDYPGALFVSAGGYHHHVGMNTWAARAASAGPDDARLLSWTLALPSTSEVEITVESIKSAGYHVASQDGPLLVQDPWGITVELVSTEDSPTHRRTTHTTLRGG